MSIALAFRQFALAILMVAGTATAAFPQTDDEATDPPGRVGRLGYMEGTVSFRNADEDQWVPATLNFPVTTGDAFWTEPNSRAEIQIGSTDLRLDQTTAIQVIQLDDAATQIQVDQGSINLRVRDMPPGGIRLVTPRVSVEVMQPGRYHVDVAAPQGDEPSKTVRVAVLEGAARADGPDASLTVTSGNSATYDDQRQPLLAEAIARPLDTWALERERRLTSKQTQQYVSPEMTGAQELDNYGQWTTEPTYGAVWYPAAVPVDWAPYRYGHWAFVAPWGWTWIDQQPWGFAPFHFGRWVRVHNRWGWCPGVRVHRPVFAPGLVAFAASGHGAILVTPGSRRPPFVGWVPLGPREVFHPSFRHSPRFFRDVNIANVHVTNITVIDKNNESFRSFHNRDGLTVVSASAFTGAMAANKARVLVRERDWADARRADSLDDFKPSRSARAGVVVPSIAAASADQPQRFRRGDRDDHSAPPANMRPAMAAARDPDMVPRAPGPDRWQRTNAGSNRPRSAGGLMLTQQDRQPTVTPLQRTDRAAPALRAPDSTTAAPPALRSVEPPGRLPNTTTAPPPGRNPNFNREMRDNREPTSSRIDNTRNTPRFIAPSQQPQSIPQSQMPAGNAPQSIAPQSPTPLFPPSSVNPRNHGSQLRTTNPTTQPRSLSPSRESAPSLQRQPRSDQMRSHQRDARRAPTIRDNTVIIPPPAVRPPPQPQATRQLAPQNADNSAPSRIQRQGAGSRSRRSDSSGGTSGGSGGGGRSFGGGGGRGR